MTRSPWLDPRGLRFAVLLALLAAIANGVWLFIDDSAPSWDQAHYLTVTLTYQQALESGGPIDLLRSIDATDPSHGPLFTALMLPFLYVFGPAANNGLLLHLLAAPILYFAAGQVAWIVFRSWIARLLAIGLVATMPILVGLYHNVLQDFLLVTLTTVALLLLLMTDGFRRGGISIALGLAMGLGTLTKVTFPLFVVGPLVVVSAQVALSHLASQRDRGELQCVPVRTLARNVGAAALAYLVVIAPWYVPNLDATLDYVRSTTSGPLSEGAGPSDPLTFDAITSFTLGVINAHVTWIILLAGLLAAILCFDRIRALLRGPLRLEPLLGLAFLLSWVLVPYLSVATAHNQDVRLMAPAMPAMAILVAGAMSSIPRPRVRLALIAVTGTLLVYQTLNHVASVTPSFLPDRISARIGSYEAVVPLSSDPIGYQRSPGPDYATPVIGYMEEVARALPGSADTPRSVCMLESEPIVNTNTFMYLATAREDPFVFADIIVEPGVKPGLGERLAGCDLALFVKQPPASPAPAESRVSLVNLDYAARYMSPELLAIFDGPERVFPVAEPSGRVGASRYLTPEGRSSQVRVLVQRRHG